jgi:hypothetical protein
VGGLFGNRRRFSYTLSRWSLGSFGKFKRFVLVKDCGSTVFYTCSACEQNQFNCVLQVHRRRVKSNKGKTKMVSKGCPVSIKVWNPCGCEISRSPDIRPKYPYPSVGQIFDARKACTDALRNYCECHRKQMFRAVDHANKVVRSCRKNGCPGLVEVSMSEIKTRGSHKWGPPLTVTKSIACMPGCQEECGEVTAFCVLCQQHMPLSRHCGFSCCRPMKAAACFDCIKRHLQSRPVHDLRLLGGTSILNQVIPVGIPSNDDDPGQRKIFFICPLLKCRWTMDQTFTFENMTHNIKDMIPVGFNKEEPVFDQAAFDRLLKAHRDNVNKHPSLNAQDTPDAVAELARRMVNEDLRAVTRASATATTMARVNLLVSNGHANSFQTAEAYLIANGLLAPRAARTAPASNANNPIEIDD